MDACGPARVPVNSRARWQQAAEHSMWKAGDCCGAGDAASADMLNGTWRLVYSSAFARGGLGGSRPGPPAALLPVKLGQVPASMCSPLLRLRCTASHPAHTCSVTPGAYLLPSHNMNGGSPCRCGRAGVLLPVRLDVPRLEAPRRSGRPSARLCACFAVAECSLSSG